MTLREFPKSFVFDTTEKWDRWLSNMKCFINNFWVLVLLCTKQRLDFFSLQVFSPKGLIERFSWAITEKAKTNFLPNRIRALALLLSPSLTLLLQNRESWKLDEKREPRIGRQTKMEMSHWLIIQVLTRIIMTNQLLCRYNLLKKVVVNNKKLRAIKTPCFRVLCTIWDFFGLIMNHSAEALLHGKFLTQVEKKNPFFFFSFSWRNLCFSLRSTDDSLWGFFLVFLAGCLYYSCSIVVATETSEKEPGG